MSNLDVLVDWILSNDEPAMHTAPKAHFQADRPTAEDSFLNFSDGYERRNLLHLEANTEVTHLKTLSRTGSPVLALSHLLLLVLFHNRVPHGTMDV